MKLSKFQRDLFERCVRTFIQAAIAVFAVEVSNPDVSLDSLQAAAISTELAGSDSNTFSCGTRRPRASTSMKFASLGTVAQPIAAKRSTMYARSSALSAARAPTWS